MKHFCDLSSLCKASAVSWVLILRLSASMTRLNGTTCSEQSKQQQMRRMEGGRGEEGRGEIASRPLLNELLVAPTTNGVADRLGGVSVTVGDTDARRRATVFENEFFFQTAECVCVSARLNVSPRTQRTMRSYDWPSRRRCLLWIYSLSPPLLCLSEKSSLHNFDVFQLEPGKRPGASIVSVPLPSAKLLTR